MVQMVVCGTIWGKRWVGFCFLSFELESLLILCLEIIGDATLLWS